MDSSSSQSSSHLSSSEDSSNAPNSSPRRGGGDRQIGNKNNDLNKSATSSSGSFVSVSSALPSSPTKQLDTIEVVIGESSSASLGENTEGSVLNDVAETEISALLLSAKVTAKVEEEEDSLSLSAASLGEKEKNSAHPPASPADSQDSSSSVSTAEELDVCSSKFNPLKALYSPFFPLDPDAPVFDNVEKFVTVYEARGREQFAKAKERAESEAKTSSATRTTRQFLPEQMPIAGTRKEHPDVLKYMSRQEDRGGPLSVLSRCVRENARVKVFVRGIDRLRGHCTGFIVAFDKHWNLAMVDVDECYTRRRFLKTPALMETTVTKERKKEGVEKTEQVGTSLVRVVKSRRKNQYCERHAAQLVLRGEHVAFVSIL